MALKAVKRDSSKDDDEMVYITRRFQRMMRRNSCFPKKKELKKIFKNKWPLLQMQKFGRLIKDCPHYNQDNKDYIKNNLDKARWNNLVPNHFNQEKH